MVGSRNRIKIHDNQFGSSTIIYLDKSIHWEQLDKLEKIKTKIMFESIREQQRHKVIIPRQKGS